MNTYLVNKFISYYCIMAKFKWATIGLLFLSILLILSLKNIIPVVEPFKGQEDPPFCSDDVCPAGCTKPTEITGTCPSTIFKDDTNYYRKCPWGCPDGSKSCKYDSCCAQCGLAKMPANYDGTDDAQDSSGAASSSSDLPPVPSPTHVDTTIDVASLSSAVDDYYKQNKGSQFTRQYPCEKTTTGLYTDCGPQGVDYTCF